MTIDQSTADAFANSWNNLPPGTVYSRAQAEDWFAPLTRQDVEGRRVLELGCGNGSLLVHMAAWKPAYLEGVDLGDTLVMTMTATIAGAISMLANFGIFFGGSRNRDNPLGAIGTILLLVLAPLAAMIVQMAISRTREYGADRGGAEISGNPAALASALAKISDAAHQIENPSAEANPATAHMFIINPLSGRRMDNLFSTHPDPRNRIDALMAMAGDMRASTPFSGPWSQSTPRKTGPWG